MSTSPVYYHHSINDLDDDLLGEFEASALRLSMRGPTFWTDPKLKRLSGPYGSSYRLRIGRYRTAFSLSGTADSAPTVWIHAVGARKEIYDRPMLRHRANEWLRHERIGKLDALGYVRWTPLDPGASAVEDEEEVLPMLSEQQVDFCNGLLPFSDDASTGDVVFLGHGPPGSGKTVVAADAAADAHEHLDYDVLVLVPSRRLLRDYGDLLRHRGLTALAWSECQTSTLWDGVVVETVESFFGSLEERRPTDLEHLHAWLTTVAESPQLRKWASKHPCVMERRFALLFTSAWEDPGLRVAGKKDAAVLADGDYRTAMRALGRHAAFVEAARRKEGIVLRWECARAAAGLLTSLRPDRRVLVVVDEVQDLVPAEWRALVEGVLQRRHAGWNTRLALLGDENQRLAPTSFSWNTVKQYLQSFPDSPPPVETELQGSFRMKRQVGAVANELASLARQRASRDGQKARHVSVAPVEKLEEGGKVVVVVSREDAWDAVSGAAARVEERVRRGSIAVVGGDDNISKALDSMRVEEAKGCEWDRVVVVDPLRHRGLDYDSLIRTYTAVTRAREHVLCVLGEASWARLQKAGVWSHLDPVDATQLAAELRRCAVTEDETVQVDRLATRIDNLLEAAEADGAARFPREVLELVANIVRLGGARRIFERFERGLEGPNTSNWNEDVRVIAVDDNADAALRIAAWLLLGDLGAAARVAETPGAGSTFGNAAKSLLDVGSGYQRLSWRARPAGVAEGTLTELIPSVVDRRVLNAVQDLPQPWEIDHGGGLTRRAFESSAEHAVRTSARALEANGEEQMRRTNQRVGRVATEVSRSVRERFGAIRVSVEGLLAKVENLEAAWGDSA